MSDTAPHSDHNQAGATPPLSLDEQVIAALKSVYDPEIPVDIYELGLIYEVHVSELERHADIIMTLTAPGCPVAGSMPGWVEEAVSSVAGIDTVAVEMTFEPPWQPDMMSMRAKLELNMF